MARSIRTVVVGVATLREPDPVLRAALALAARSGAALHVVHAFEVAGHVLERYRGMGYSECDPVRLFAEGLQAAWRGRCAPSPSAAASSARRSAATPAGCSRTPQGGWTPTW